MFPSETPTDGLDTPSLARLNVAGGKIKNIPINAAFLAAKQAEVVHMACNAGAQGIREVRKSLDASRSGGMSVRDNRQEERSKV